MVSFSSNDRSNRVFEFSEFAGLPDRYVALLDKKRNVLTIRKEHFDLLSPLDKQRVYDCQTDAVTWIWHMANPPTLVFENNPIISIPDGAIITCTFPGPERL